MREARAIRPASLNVLNAIEDIRHLLNYFMRETKIVFAVSKTRVAYICPDEAFIR